MSVGEVWTIMLAAAGGVITLVKAGEVLEKLLGRSGMKKELCRTQEALRESARRLDRAERAIISQQAGMSVMFNALLGIARHLRTGETSRLEAAEQEIQSYLTHRREGEA